MEDKFMFELQQQPSSTFSSDLQQRLMLIDTNQRSRRKARQRITAFAVLAVAVVLIASFSIPTVRAGIRAAIINIAGQVFNVTGDYPSRDDAVTEVTPETLPVDQAIAKFPFAIQLPAALPDGYQLDAKADLYLGHTDYPDMLELSYFNAQPGNGRIFFIAYPVGAVSGSIVGPDSLEEVAITENLTGALVKGGWSYNTKQWESFERWHLSWKQDGVDYALLGPDKDVLIAMAASLR
jgi:hypothetical protein